MFLLQVMLLREYTISFSFETSKEQHGLEMRCADKNIHSLKKVSLKTNNYALFSYCR